MKKNHNKRQHLEREQNKKDIEQFLEQTKIDPKLLQQTIKLHRELGYNHYKSFIWVYQDLWRNKNLKDKSKYLARLSKNKQEQQKPKNTTKTQKYKMTKSDRKLWWRSLTAEEQLEYRCNKFDEEGVSYNRDEEWSKILRENLYLK